MSRHSGVSIDSLSPSAQAQVRAMLAAGKSTAVASSFVAASVTIVKGKTIRQRTKLNKLETAWHEELI